jgi:hypothetical protein
LNIDIAKLKANSRESEVATNRSRLSEKGNPFCKTTLKNEWNALGNEIPFAKASTNAQSLQNFYKKAGKKKQHMVECQHIKNKKSNEDKKSMLVK